MTAPAAPTPTKQNTLAGCLLRFTWMAGGNLVLFFLAVAIAQRGSWRPDLLDAAFAAVTLGLVAVRFADIRLFEGQNTEGERATLVDWRRYVMTLAGAAAVLWLLAHVVGALGLLG
jgi:hypothetical protein